jgi:hypothetical protein
VYVVKGEAAMIVPGSDVVVGARIVEKPDIDMSDDRVSVSVVICTLPWRGAWMALRAISSSTSTIKAESW